ncbi:hypothetical protein D3C72_1967040 [compost metagenome]
MAGQTGHIRKQVGGIGLDPALVDVGGTLGDAVVNDGGEAATHRPLPFEVFDQRLEGVGDGGRGGRLRGGQAVTFTDEHARLGIDQAALDPGSPYIYSQHLHQSVPFSVPRVKRRQSMKK